MAEIGFASPRDASDARGDGGRAASYGTAGLTQYADNAWLSFQTPNYCVGSIGPEAVTLPITAVLVVIEGFLHVNLSFELL